MLATFLCARRSSESVCSRASGLNLPVQQDQGANALHTEKKPRGAVASRGPRASSRQRQTLQSGEGGPEPALLTPLPTPLHSLPETRPRDQRSLQKKKEPSVWILGKIWRPEAPGQNTASAKIKETPVLEEGNRKVATAAG